MRYRLVTPDEDQQREVLAVGFRSNQGPLTILPDHAHLISPVIPGELIIQEDARRKSHYQAKGGFIQVDHNEVTFLTEEAPLKISTITSIEQ